MVFFPLLRINITGIGAEVPINTPKPHIICETLYDTVDALELLYKIHENVVYIRERSICYNTQVEEGHK